MSPCAIITIKSPSFPPSLSLSFFIFVFRYKHNLLRLYNTCIFTLVGAHNNHLFRFPALSFLQVFFFLNMWFNSSGRVSKQRHNVRVRRLDRLRRLRKGAGTEIQMKNLKLYVENQIIIEANERLRAKALLLHQENQTLLAQLQNKFSDTQNQL
ncbi:hypothetical protein GQ457_06G032580 [Hibiscus cannabinus]